MIYVLTTLGSYTANSQTAPRAMIIACRRTYAECEKIRDTIELGPNWGPNGMGIESLDLDAEPRVD